MVWRTARQLDAALTGQVLTRSDFRVPRFATASLAGRSVLDSVSRGKHLLIRVEGDVTVHTHLRMDGSWRIRPAGGYLPRDHRIRLVLANERWQAVGYLLGVVELLRTANEDRAVGHLGPDLLGPDWDPAEAVRRLRSDPARPAGDALLDQRHLAGIGNLYKAEVLFLRGIDPWCPIGAIDDLTALVELARRLMEANKERTVQVTTGTDRPGEQTWVYGRSGRPCRRCGTRILAAGSGRPPNPGWQPGPASNARPAGQTGNPDARITFWCPSCQPARTPSQVTEPGRTPT